MSVYLSFHLSGYNVGIGWTVLSVYNYYLGIKPCFSVVYHQSITNKQRRVHVVCMTQTHQRKLLIGDTPCGNVV